MGGDLHQETISESHATVFEDAESLCPERRSNGG